MGDKEKATSGLSEATARALEIAKLLPEKRPKFPANELGTTPAAAEIVEIVSTVLSGDEATIFDYQPRMNAAQFAAWHNQLIRTSKPN